MIYGEEIIEEVRSRNDIVDLISTYVPLKKKGSSYFGLCPFHNEKSPSFSVSRDKQMYYCFGCGAGGNVFTFLMEYENFSFPEALKYLAERAGMELPEEELNEEAKRAMDEKARLREMNKLSANYFYYLLHSKRGQKGLAYLKDRGITDATIKHFGLGYADIYNDDLYRFLKSKGYSDEDLKDSALVTIDERRGGSDKFWNRVMFPIMDVHNKVIGFGGRVMGDGEPKYLNSPETKIFDKSRNLYGLNFARATKKPQLLLCEGYMDVIALHQAGFDNAVASLGTALTSGHANLLKRYTKEVYLTYDSDGAGIKAALRAIPILKEVGITTKIINMKPYKDPDEFIKALGAEAYQERIDQAENSFLFEVRMEEQQHDMHDPEGKTAFYNAVAKMLCGFTEKLERDNYIEAVAAKYMISPDDLRRLVNQQGLKAGLAGGGRAPQSVADAQDGARTEYKKSAKKREDGMVQSQKLLLTWLTNSPALFPKVQRYVGADDFTDPICHSVAKMLFEQYEKDGTVNPARIISTYEDEEQQREAAGILNATIHRVDTREEREKALRETVIRVRENSINHKLANTFDVQEMAALAKEKNELPGTVHIPLEE